MIHSSAAGRFTKTTPSSPATWRSCSRFWYGAAHTPAASFLLLCTCRAPRDSSTRTTTPDITWNNTHSSTTASLTAALPLPEVNRSVSTTAAQRSDDIFDRIRWTQTTFQIEERGDRPLDRLPNMLCLSRPKHGSASASLQGSV